MMKAAMVIAALCVAASASAGWQQTLWDFDPATDLLSDGTLFKASNFGQTAQAVTVGGIAFDTDYSNTDVIAGDFQWAGAYYNGDDSAIQNLMNNGAHHYAWGSRTLTINLSGLTAGHEYRIQFMVAADDGGRGVDIYSTDWSDYSYDWLGGETMLRTFVWTADAAEKTFYVGVNHDNWSSFNILGYAVHDLTAIPEPATLLLVGFGALVSLKRKR